MSSIFPKDGIREDRAKETDAEINESDHASNFSLTLEAVQVTVTSDEPQNRENKKKTVSKGKHHDKRRFLNKKTQDSSFKGRRSETGQSHDNHAFQDDNDSVATTHSDKYQSIAADTDKEDVIKDGNCKITKENDGEQLNLRGDPACVKRHYPKLKDSSLPAVVDEWQSDYNNSGNLTLHGHDTTTDIIFETNDNEIGRCLDQSNSREKEQSELLHETSGTNYLTLSLPDHQACVDNVEVIPVTGPRRSEENRLARPHNRSNSSVTSNNGLNTELGSQIVQRSYSMRVNPVSDPVKPKVRSLLRDLSFSDSDAKKVRNYGALRASQFIPKRKLPQHAENDGDSEKDVPVQMTSELQTHLMKLMHELLSRGKIRQVAVLEQGCGSMLVSLPPWKLPHKDEIGLVKTTTCTLQTMLKMTVGHQVSEFLELGTSAVLLSLSSLPDDLLPATPLTELWRIQTK